MKYLDIFSQTGSMNGMIKMIKMITDLYTWVQKEHGEVISMIIILMMMMMMMMIDDD